MLRRDGRFALTFLVALLLVASTSAGFSVAARATPAVAKGSLSAFTAADLTSEAPVPALVRFTAPPAGVAEVQARSAGVTWTAVQRQSAEEEVAAGQDRVLAEAIGRGIDVRMDMRRVAGASGDEITSAARLTYLTNGVRVLVPGSQLGALSAMRGVEEVIEDRPRRRLELTRSVPYVEAPEVQAPPSEGGFGVDGAGTVVAVIDTGIDWDHPMFGGAPYTTPSSSPNPPSVGERCASATPAPRCATANRKVIYAAVFGRSGATPRDDQGHGTHVASTAAGVLAPSPRGSIEGVAPGARLMGFKVLNILGSGSGSDVLAAMEDASKASADHPRADVVNMSLGGDPDNALHQAEADAADLGTDLGIVFVLANGNEGAEGRASLSSPATALKAISVGNGGDPGNGPSEFSITGITGGFPAILATDIATSSDAPAAPVSGTLRDCGINGTTCPLSTSTEIAVVSSQTGTFEQSKDNIEATGSPAAIVFLSTQANPAASLVTKPKQPAFVLGANGSAAVKTAFGQTGTLAPYGNDRFPNSLAASSSQGPVADYTIKPDVVAPGTRIHAARSRVCSSTCTPAYGTLEGDYVIISGTSMAAPHVAGSAALLLQAHPTWTPEQVKAALAGTGRYLADPSLSVNQQGSGGIRTLEAARTPSLLLPTQVSFGAVPIAEGASRAVFRRMSIADVRSGGAGTLTYDLGVRYGRNMPRTGFTVDIRSAADPLQEITSVIVPAGGSADFLVRASVLADAQPLAGAAEGPWEGFEFYVEARPTDASLPMLHAPGFYRLLRGEGAAPAQQAPTLHDVGAGTRSGTYDLTWDGVSDGAMGYRIDERSVLDAPTMLATDSAEGTTRPTDRPAVWSSDGGWTTASANNHTPGGSKSYFSGQGSDRNAVLKSASFDGATRLRFWEFVDTEPDFDFATVFAETSGGTIPLRRVSGSSGGLREVTMDLPLGTTGVRFVYTSDSNTDTLLYDGWYIDDVEILREEWAPIGQTAATTFRVSDRPAGDRAYRVVALRPNASDAPTPSTASNVRRRLVVQAAAPSVVSVGEDVSFSVVPVAATLSAAWRFSDGRSATGWKPKVRFDAPGTYTATATVVDETGASGTDTVVVQVAQSPASARGAGYTLVGGDGGIFNFGAALFHGSTGDKLLNAPVIGMAYTPSGGGYWLVAKDGGIFTFGDATFYGSTGSMPLNAPVLGMEATPTGRGYWLFAADGGIFTFGDAAFFGSTGDKKLNAPVVGLATTEEGSGYWLVAQDGGIFTFGDAPFHGSTGDQQLAQPVFDLAPAGGDDGYWLVARDGGIFTFGSAQFHGSAVPFRPGPVVGIATSSTRQGYWIADQLGAVYPFGDAAALGDLGSTALNAPIVGFAASP